MVHIRIEDIEEYARLNHIPIMLKDGIDYLVNYIKNNNIKSILEIGTAIGYSSIKMALVNDNITITTIERVKDSTNCSRNTKQLVKKIQLYIDFLKNNSEFNTTFISVGDGISISKKR